jgi:hypothetical protein
MSLEEVECIGIWERGIAKESSTKVGVEFIQTLGPQSWQLFGVAPRLA